MEIGIILHANRPSTIASLPFEKGGKCHLNQKGAQIILDNSPLSSFFALLQPRSLSETMLLELDDWYMGYSQILSDCRESNGESTSGASVLILAHADVDALCSARILSYMLRADGVSYELRPCRSFQKLQEICANLATDGLTYRAIVLLNLGAHRNLTRLFQSAASEAERLSPETMKAYVMDCRRPVHLANIHAGDNVVVFLETRNDQEIPSDGDNLSGNESSTDDDVDDDDTSSESESDQDEGEAEFEDDEDDGENEFGKENEPMDEDEPRMPEKTAKDFEQDNDYDAEDEDEGQTKRQKTLQESDDTASATAGATQATVPATADDSIPAMTPRQLHEDRRNRLRSYYSSGSTFGSPAAFCAYKIATQLRFGDLSDLLWLACVGVTDAYLHARLDVAGYSQFAIFLRDSCQRLFPNDMYHRVGSAVYAEHLTNGFACNSGGDASTRTKISFAGTGRILSETDFRFFLLRHSSLLDGMRYSDYCASKLGNHNAALPKLRELLAKMGYPLTECQQPFSLMKPSLRSRLRDQIREFAPEYGLDNLEFTSFFRVTGYQSLLSASDMTYAVSALLEAVDGEGSNDEDDQLLQAFHRSYEALNSYASAPSSLSLNSSNLSNLVNGAAGGGGLATGLRLAMARQRAILSTAASLVERNAIVRLSHFRYAYVTGTQDAQGGDDWQTSGLSTNEAKSRTMEDVLFAQPLALLRLAHYLMDVHRENDKWTGSRARPLILIAARNSASFLVVGYEFPEASGSVVANTFGKHFELAAQSMQGTFRFDSFDSNVVEVGSKDVQRFIEQLHYLLDSI